MWQQLCLTTYNFPSFTHTTGMTHFLDICSSFGYWLYSYNSQRISNHIGARNNMAIWLGIWLLLITILRGPSIKKPNFLKNLLTYLQLKLVTFTVLPSILDTPLPTSQHSPPLPIHRSQLHSTLLHSRYTAPNFTVLPSTPDTPLPPSQYSPPLPRHRSQLHSTPLHSRDTAPNFTVLPSTPDTPLPTSQYSPPLLIPRSQLFSISGTRPETCYAVRREGPVSNFLLY